MARLEADEISNEGNTGRPNFPNGVGVPVQIHIDFSTYWVGELLCFLLY